MRYLHFDNQKFTDLYNFQLVRWLIARGYIPKDKNIKILDLGSGLGRFYFNLKKLGYKNVVAADKYPQFKECVNADASSKLPFKNNTFDLVMSRDLAEHILNHENFFSEQNRILKKGGRIIVMTPNVEKLSMGDFYSTYTHIMPYTPSSMTRALLLHNFDNVRVRRLRGIPLIWRKTIRAFDFVFSRKKNNILAIGIKS